MLSYRHAFHAGNFADVLKHWVLMLLLDYLNQKEKPYWYIDTHAGAGCYQLDSAFANKNAEFQNGITQLWDRTDFPESLQPYIQLIKQLNPSGALKLYPGSPYIAQRSLRSQDKMRLFELHPSDFELLTANFADDRNKPLINKMDGFSGLKALLPPPPRRALVLIDPPYENKADYQLVVSSLADGLKRFSSGMYVVWYPLLQRPEVANMLNKLKSLPAKSWLDVSLTVQKPNPDGFGMYGTGMFVLNPPWTLHKTLEQTMPELTKLLGQDKHAHFKLAQQEH